MQTKNQSDKITEILVAKSSSGESAYLWLHDSGDCILWPDEDSSENDNGANAIERWQLTPDEASELEDIDTESDVVIIDDHA